jgi:hypothetical protein
VVEGLSLDPDQGIVALLELELLGDVLVDVGDAALRMRIGDDAQGLAVGQVPPVLLGLERLIGGVQEIGRASCRERVS